MSTVPSPVVKEAIESGSAAVLGTILTADPSLANARVDWDGRSVDALTYLIQAPFHGLCPRGEQGEMARVLLDFGADADWDATTDPRGETPLMSAVSLYETEIVDVLLDRGVDLERRGAVVDGGTALDDAIAFAATREVDRLVAAGAVTGTPFRAAGAGKVEELREHLEGHAPTGRELVAATINARLDCLAVLAEAGADLRGTYEDATLLHWAAWHGRTEVVDHLLGLGLDPHAPCVNHQLTPKGWALYRRDEKKWPFPDGLTAVVQRLEAAGA